MAKIKRRKANPVYETPEDDLLDGLIIEPGLTYNPVTGETLQTYTRLPSSPPTTRPQTPDPGIDQDLPYDEPPLPGEGQLPQNETEPKRRFQGASTLMGEFLPRLDKMQAAYLATQSYHTAQSSSLVPSICACSSASALYRCTDCFFNPKQCCACIVNAHAHNPFHRIGTWNGTSYTPTDLYYLSLVIHLGHAGQKCPHILDSSKYNMTVVHTNGTHPASITFCACAPAKDRDLQLIEAKLFPATVSRTETVLTFIYLEDLHMHTICSKKSVYDHHSAIQRLKDPINPHLVPDRCRESTRALRVWQILAKNRRSGQYFGIDNYLPLRRPGSLTTRCFACPEIGFNLEKTVSDGANKSECHKYTLFLSLDGNFRLQRVNKLQDVDDVALTEGHGYFVDDDKYQEYLKHVQPSPDVRSQLSPFVRITKRNYILRNSTCAHLRAVRLQNIIKFKNAAVSGVVSVQCARHGFYMSNGTADLEKGEAYAWSDYVLVQVLDENQQLRWIMVSYDIWCQYWKNFPSRVASHFPDKMPLVDKLRGAIPKMHIKNHIEKCQVCWSFNYLPYSGETCGEKIETSWAEQNQAASSTKQQNAGHRHDSLNDHFDFWNWCKHQTLIPYLEARYIDCKQRLEKREKSFAELGNTIIKTYSAQTLAEWKVLDPVPQCKDEVWTSPFIARSKLGRPPSQLKAYHGLLEAEKIVRLAGLGEGGDAAFVSKALKIEAEQHRVRVLLASKEPSLSDIATARLNVQSLLKPWLDMQELRYPKLRDDKPSIDLTQPELVTLYLASCFPIIRPPELQPLVAIELALREGQCHDALESLRLAIKTFNINFQFKRDSVQSQHPNTRAQVFLGTLIEDKVSAFNKYNRCRDALLKLGFPEDDKTLQPLAKSELWGRNMGVPAELGDTREDEPWFWVVGRPSGLSSEDEKDWNYEVDRARWFRLQAVVDRGREEKEILEEEIFRVYEASNKMNSIWTSIAMDTLAPGAVCYAHKQAVMYASFSDEALKSISGPFRSAFERRPNFVLPAKEPAK